MSNGEAGMKMEAIVAEETSLAWYALRVEARHVSVGDCPRRKLQPVAPRPIVVDGKSAVEPTTPWLRGEFVVEAAMRRRGVEAWVPVESVFNRANRFHHKAKKLVYRPILPGLVFVGFSAPPNWLAVLDCPMVRGVFGCDGRPSALRQKDLDQMRKIESGEQAAAVERFMPTNRVFTVGQEVEVLEGSLEGERITVLEMDGLQARFLHRGFRMSIGLEKIGAVA